MNRAEARLAGRDLMLLPADFPPAVTIPFPVGQSARPARIPPGSRGAPAGRDAARPVRPRPL